MKLQINQRNKTAMKIGGICAAVILLFNYVFCPWFSHWERVKAELAGEKTKLELIETDRSAARAAKHAALTAAVPVFEMPQSEDKQRLIFESKFIDQAKKTGIQFKSVNYHAPKKTKNAIGYKLLHLQCRGKCKFDQLTNLLAGLNENPHFVGIEELQIKCNEKKRSEMDLVLTVSTFAR